MSTVMPQKLALFAFSLVLLTIVSPTSALAKDSLAKPKAYSAQDEEAIKAVSSSLTRNLAAGDSKAVAALWTEDATYVDSDGFEYKGRKALEARFSSVFNRQGKQVVTFQPDTLKILVPGAFMAEGTVLRKVASGALIPETRYSIVFVKQNGQWLISSATETVIANTEDVNPLEALSWLIGEWHAEGNGAIVSMKAEWTANKNFITCIYNAKSTGDLSPVESKQVIGFDPNKNLPVSWHFDSTGGFGNGNWIKKNDQWLVENSGTERNGNTTSACTIFTVESPDQFTWQSVDRRVDGEPVGDTNVLRVSRVLKVSSTVK
ncbi:MAG: SgcJ/EcaC family oxidoreductase [Candidatus Obscuribacterales bacterium]|nr:SgcJ/EcaC family oxidoreductase [Candidatus Obscuribacterales bacterium]